MTNTQRNVLKVLLPLLAVAAGVGGLNLLMRTKPQAERTERPRTAALVELTEAVGESHDVVVEAQGTVIPARQVVLMPEVGGRVTWVSPDLVPGGRVREGQTLLRIDPRDYQVALEQQGAQLGRAQLDLELEQGRQVVAQREWELFGDEEQQGDAQSRARALREPQLRTANVSVRAAESALKQARLNLRRTVLTAPFDGSIQAENVEVGQLVGPQSQTATLVGTDAYWVQVSIPLEKLSWIDVPGVNAAEGAWVTVRQLVGEQRIVRRGRVMRLLQDLDPVGRMARVLVEILDPLGLEEADDSRRGLPLLLRAYVHVEIEGHRLDDVFEVPRVALREGDRVYVMSRDNRLQIREVNIAWRSAETVWVREGLRNGDRVVTSRLPGAVEGMPLRHESTEPEQPRPARAEAP